MHSANTAAPARSLPDWLPSAPLLPSVVPHNACAGGGPSFSPLPRLCPIGEQVGHRVGRALHLSETLSGIQTLPLFRRQRTPPGAAARLVPKLCLPTGARTL